MKRSLYITIASGLVGVMVLTVGSKYFLSYYSRWSQSCSEQEAIAYLQHEILSFRSLDFQPSSELITVLTAHEDALEKIYEKRNAQWQLQEEDFNTTKKIDALIAVNKKMLEGYLKDLQQYTQMDLPKTSSIVKFSYDKVVRLTIALHELEENYTCEVPAEEYVKKIERMHEITRQVIGHYKKELRTYLQSGIKETDVKIQTVRHELTEKIKDLIALDKLLYL